MAILPGIEKSLVFDLNSSFVPIAGLCGLGKRVLRKVIYYDKITCGLVCQVQIQGSAQRSALRTRVGGGRRPPIRQPLTSSPPHLAQSQARLPYYYTLAFGREI